MSGNKPPRVGAICLRIILFANCMAIVVYGAITPHQMSKNTAECVAIGIGALAMAVQTYATLIRYLYCFPYSIWSIIGLDGLCAAGWIAAIAILSYWDINVVYRPSDDDPDDWLRCADAKTWDKVLTSDGVGHWVHIEWCKVEVDGRSRLIGNSAARMQLHVLIGLSVVSLLFTGFILLWMVKTGQQRRLIKKTYPVTY